MYLKFSRDDNAARDADAAGGIAGECQKRTGKEQRGEARITENVSGDLIYGEFVRPASVGHFFM